MYNINQFKGGNIMQNNKKDIFYIADLCIITDIKEINNQNNNLYTRYYYDFIDKKIVYSKGKNYIDIETNQKYTTKYNNIGDEFIKIGSIIAFSDFLKSNRIQYNKNDIKNKKKVKELYKTYKR